MNHSDRIELPRSHGGSQRATPVKESPDAFNRRHRASGLNLVTAAIILWNTVYLDRAVMALRQSGYALDDALLPHIAPVHWNHINLTGDYSWRQNKRVEKGRFRPLRMPKA
jgi:hypothetical protein